MLPHPEYLLASRQGLFRVSRAGASQLTTGRFFGVVLHDGAVFAFRSRPGEEGEDTEHSGQIVRYDWRDGGALGGPRVMVGDLDYNCHQIDFFDGAFFVVDTFHQCIREYDPEWRAIAHHQILPEAVRNGPDHAHINSIAGDAQTVRVLLHNQHRGRPSEIVEYDRAFRERSRRTLPCDGCHDIIPLENGRILTCLSPRGEIMLDDGLTVAINEYWTRGVAVTPGEIAVGSSFYGARVARAILPGFVTFLGRDFKEQKRIYVPAAPTQMRAL